MAVQWESFHGPFQEGLIISTVLPTATIRLAAALIIIIYSYLSRDIPTDLSVFLQGALTKYIIECVDHEVMWHCEYQEEQSST